MENRELLLAIRTIKNVNVEDGINKISATEIKNWGRDLKIKNWWKMKKSEVIVEIEKLLSELDAEEIVERMTKAKEKKKETKIVTVPEEIKEEQITIKEKPQEKNLDTLVTIKDILFDLDKEGIKIRGTKARRILRAHEIERPYKQWEWDSEEHNDIITSVIELLKTKK